MRRRRYWRASAIGAVLVLALGPTFAHLQRAEADTGGPVTEYAPFPIAASFPCEVKYDAQGNMWTDQFAGNAIGEVNPATGAISEVPLPNPGAEPGGMETASDGDIYFIEVAGNAIGRLDPVTKTIATFPFPWANAEVGGLPSVPGLNLGLGVPFDLTTGPDGGVWFTMVGLNAIGRFDITTHAFQMFPVRAPASGLIAMEPGPGSTIAFTEASANQIGTIDVYTHQVREYPIPTPGSFPAGLTTSPDGKTIWFGETLGQNIGALDPVTGQVREYNLVTLSGILGGGVGDPAPQPGQLAFGSDGDIYIMEGTFDGGSRVGQFNPRTLAYSVLPTPTAASSPCDLNTSVPGTVVFGEFTGNRVATFSIPDNGVVPYPL